MDRRDVLTGVLVFGITFILGFSGEALMESESEYQGKFSSDKVFEANSSDVIKDVTFDNRTVQLIIKPGNESEFFLSINDTVEKIKPVERDGEVHDLKKIFTVGEKMYIFDIQYTDGTGTENDWIRVQRIKEL